MKTFQKIMLAGVAALICFSAVGCDRPDRSESELGEIVTKFPEPENRRTTLPLPEGADSNCDHRAKSEFAQEIIVNISNEEKARQERRIKAEQAAQAKESTQTENAAPAE